MSKRKHKIIEILNRDTVVARTSKENPEYIEIIDDTIEPPMNLFYGRQKVHITDYINWLKTRAFPEYRCGADKLLKQMGLDKHDPIKIAMITGARMAQDQFSIREY